jgi:hypothetical protein
MNKTELLIALLGFKNILLKVLKILGFIGFYLSLVISMIAGIIPMVFYMSYFEGINNEFIYLGSAVFCTLLQISLIIFKSVKEGYWNAKYDPNQSLMFNFLEYFPEYVGVEINKKITEKWTVMKVIVLNIYFFSYINFAMSFLTLAMILTVLMLVGFVVSKVYELAWATVGNLLVKTSFMNNSKNLESNYLLTNVFKNSLYYLKNKVRVKNLIESLSKFATEEDRAKVESMNLNLEIKNTNLKKDNSKRL